MLDKNQDGMYEKNNGYSAPFQQTLSLILTHIKILEIPASREFLGADAQLLGTSLAGGTEYRNLWPLKQQMQRLINQYSKVLP